MFVFKLYINKLFIYENNTKMLLLSSLMYHVSPYRRKF